MCASSNTIMSGDEMTPYERLFGDALRGDRTLFGSEAGVEAAWRIVDAVLSSDQPLCEYDAGSRGPIEAEQLVGRGGWIEPGVVVRGVARVPSRAAAVAFRPTRRTIAGPRSAALRETARVDRERPVATIGRTAGCRRGTRAASPAGDRRPRRTRPRAARPARAPARAIRCRQCIASAATALTAYARWRPLNGAEAQVADDEIETDCARADGGPIRTRDDGRPAPAGGWIPG